MRTNTEPAKADRGVQEPPWLRPLSEYGPIAVFFTAYVLADLLWATAALMAATSLWTMFGLAGVSTNSTRTRSRPAASAASP